MHIYIAIYIYTYRRNVSLSCACVCVRGHVSARYEPKNNTYLSRTAERALLLFSLPLPLLGKMTTMRPFCVRYVGRHIVFNVFVLTVVFMLFPFAIESRLIALLKDKRGQSQQWHAYSLCVWQSNCVCVAERLCVCMCGRATVCVCSSVCC